MDDYSIASLQDSRNEWSARLLNILTPLVIEGFQSIFNESLKLCINNDEEEKYLMTFQNFITRVPNWNSELIESETKRILENSHCNYLEDLISCVHIIHLKSLTCMRVGTKQKKIDIQIPNLKDFVHKVYTNCARKLYSNVYLYENDIESLQVQKHNREKEIIIKECILDTLRANIPVEDLLRCYLDESIEEVVEKEEKEEIISREPIEEPIDTSSVNNDENKTNVYSEYPPTESSNKTEVIADPIKMPVEEIVEEKQSISFAPLPPPLEKSESNVNFDDDDDDEDKIKIGSEIKLEIDELSQVSSPAPTSDITMDNLLENEIEILT